MHFQLRTDNHIPSTAGFADRVQAEVEGVLTPRFGDRIRRVEVYVQDVNAHKGGIDVRCAVEVHLAGLAPVAVDARAAGVDDAVTAALDKALRAVEHRLGRLADRAGHTPASGQEV